MWRASAMVIALSPVLHLVTRGANCVVIQALFLNQRAEKLSRCTQIGSSALSVQLQTKSSELTYSSQQLGCSSGKAERLIA